MNGGRVSTRAEAFRNRGRRLDAEARARREKQRRTEMAVQARGNALRERGRILDQTELCYRQYTPQQIAQADEMMACGTTIHMEDISS